MSTYIYTHAVFKNDLGPGPSHFLDPAVTRSGPEGTPRYSIGSRHKELMAFKTPGPGSYAPEQNATCFQKEKKEPAFSMGSRSKYRKSKGHCYSTRFSFIWAALLLCVASRASIKIIEYTKICTSDYYRMTCLQTTQTGMWNTYSGTYEYRTPWD